MGLWNRLSLLASYLRRKSVVQGRPVEYIVETTARCNLFCPMCPRESQKQPNKDMPEEVFNAFVDQTSDSAEAAMLVGLGEPLLDRRIIERVTRCRSGHISAVLSTNGTLLDEAAAIRLLDTGLDHIILSFDGATKETYEKYRKGARFEEVRDNFVRFIRLKHERKARTHITVQMILMESSRPEVDAFLKFWRALPGVDEVRIKEDESDILPKQGHAPEDRKWPCHYLWRGPMYIKVDGDVHPCYPASTLGAAPIGNLLRTPLPQLWNGEDVQRMRTLHLAGRSGEIDVCRRCCATIPHPVLVTGSLLLHGNTVRKLIPRVERGMYLTQLPTKLLTPPKAQAPLLQRKTDDSDARGRE